MSKFITFIFLIGALALPCNAYEYRSMIATQAALIVMTVPEEQPDPKPDTGDDCPDGQCEVAPKSPPIKKIEAQSSYSGRRLFKRR
jgi:hypothetical protein